jgi:hypothetical protein
MAPARKLAERRQRRNTSDIGLVALPGGKVHAPQPSKAWLVSTRSAWSRLWASQIAAVFEAESDLPALKRLFGMYDEIERCHRALKRRRFVPGSKGQPVVNPAARAIVALEPLTRALEDRYGLSPRARLQLGVTFAEAHASLRELNESLEVDDDEDPREAAG